jgi:hypothetical protein
VNPLGYPYTYGIRTWKAELNKLCVSLDPSILDIRHQLDKDMRTLRKRLKESFGYSDPVDRDYISV